MPHTQTGPDVRIEGLVQSRDMDIDSLLSSRPGGRIYRLRCVEGWSMVIPWGWAIRCPSC